MMMAIEFLLILVHRFISLTEDIKEFFVLTYFICCNTERKREDKKSKVLS